MLAEAQLQLQNAQHSVLFLQNEHAKTIAGLHEEIRNLQTKCGGEMRGIRVRRMAELFRRKLGGFDLLWSCIVQIKLKILHSENCVEKRTI